MVKNRQTALMSIRAETGRAGHVKSARRRQCEQRPVTDWPAQSRPHRAASRRSCKQRLVLGVGGGGVSRTATGLR